MGLGKLKKMLLSCLVHPIPVFNGAANTCYALGYHLHNGFLTRCQTAACFIDLVWGIHLWAFD